MNRVANQEYDRIEMRSLRTSVNNNLNQTSVNNRTDKDYFAATNSINKGSPPKQVTSPAKKSPGEMPSGKLLFLFLYTFMWSISLSSLLWNFTCPPNHIKCKLYLALQLHKVQVSTVLILNRTEVTLASAAVKILEEWIAENTIMVRIWIILRV